MPGAWRGARLASDPDRREAGLGARALYRPRPPTHRSKMMLPVGLGAAHCLVFGAIRYKQVAGCSRRLSNIVLPRLDQAQRPQAPDTRGARLKTSSHVRVTLLPRAASSSPEPSRPGSTWNAGGPHSETPSPTPPAARHRLTDGNWSLLGKRRNSPLKLNDGSPYGDPRPRSLIPRLPCAARQDRQSQAADDPYSRIGMTT